MNRLPLLCALGSLLLADPALASTGSLAATAGSEQYFLGEEVATGQTLASASRVVRRRRGHDHALVMTPDGLLSVYALTEDPDDPEGETAGPQLDGSEVNAQPFEGGWLFAVLTVDRALSAPVGDHLRAEELAPSLALLTEPTCLDGRRRAPDVPEFLLERFEPSPLRDVLVTELAYACDGEGERGSSRGARSLLEQRTLLSPEAAASYTAGAYESGHAVFAEFIDRTAARGPIVARGPGLHDSYRAYYALALRAASEGGDCNSYLRIAQMVGEPATAQWSLTRLRNQLALDGDLECFHQIDRAVAESESRMYVGNADVADAVPVFLDGISIGAPEIPRLGNSDTLPYRLALELLDQGRDGAALFLIDAVEETAYRYLLLEALDRYLGEQGGGLRDGQQIERDELRATLSGS